MLIKRCKPPGICIFLVIENSQLLTAVRKIRITVNDGKSIILVFYSLDAIIAVGYRVNSLEATQFRRWTTNTLKEYIKKNL